MQAVGPCCFSPLRSMIMSCFVFTFRVGVRKSGEIQGASARVIPDCSLGVVIVTFNAEDVIADCLESLVAASAGRLRIVLVDNASMDGTCAAIHGWASGAQPYRMPDSLPFTLTPVPKPLPVVEMAPDGIPAAGPRITLVRSGVNRGFAGGVNMGLACLARDPEIRNFWVLNPDSMVPPAAVDRLLDQLADSPPFALMGGRVAYLDRPKNIQIDGGQIDWKTGVTINLHLNRNTLKCPPPDPATLDFIMGASMVASRRFYETAGPMPEEYFLYYEEVDWAQRRGDLPLAYCAGFTIYHQAGSAIGSPGLGRSASPFSLYFKHRGRMRFLRRFRRAALPRGYAYGLGKAAQLALARDGAGARAILAGTFDRPPPAAIARRLSPEALAAVTA